MTKGEHVELARYCYLNKETTAGEGRRSNLFVREVQHVGAHVTGLHGGLICRCSSGGDVALRCCHIDAS